MLRLVAESEQYRDSGPRGLVTGLSHALQMAEHSMAAGAGTELNCVAFLHDMARPLSDAHHGEVMAEILRDRISPPRYRLLRMHGHAQSILNSGRELPVTMGPELRAFALWEVESFDPTAQLIPLNPMLNAVAWMLRG